MQEGLPLLLALAAFEREDVLLDRQCHLVRREAGERDRNLEAVLVETFDVIGGIALFGGPLDVVENIEKAVEPDGRPPEGSPIIPHSQILLGARWIRAGSGHRPAPDSRRRTPKASRPPRWRHQKIQQVGKNFKGSSQIFCAHIKKVNRRLPTCFGRGSFVSPRSTTQSFGLDLFLYGGPFGLESWARSSLSR